MVIKKQTDYRREIGAVTNLASGLGGEANKTKSRPTQRVVWVLLEGLVGGTGRQISALKGLCRSVEAHALSTWKRRRDPQKKTRIVPAMFSDK